MSSYIVYSCFLVTMAEGNGCDRDYKGSQSLNYLQSHPLHKRVY